MPVNSKRDPNAKQKTNGPARSASAAASPKIEDVRAINKLVRRVRAETVLLIFWPLKGPTRFVGYPDAAYCNNKPDKSSQRAQVIFMVESRKFLIKSNDPARRDELRILCQAESEESKKTWIGILKKQLQTQMDFLRALQAPISYHNKQDKDQ